jgi:hypothetical protein
MIDIVLLSYLLLFGYQIYQRLDWIYPVMTFAYICLYVYLKLLMHFDQEIKLMKLKHRLLDRFVSELDDRMDDLEEALEDPPSSAAPTRHGGRAAARDERSAPGCR